MPVVYDIFLSDEQIARRLGMDMSEWRPVSRALERSGLPPCDPLFQDRRHWPAVLSFLYRRAGGIMPMPAVPRWDGTEQKSSESPLTPRRRRKPNAILASLPKRAAEVPDPDDPKK